ncbi:MAG: primosomal protein N' [Gammaproteobacteria bacterium]|nr:primosomal protein N' [Gammaproteobacteria bacterium]
MLEEPILRVAVPAPLRHALEYLPPANCTAERMQAGMRVVVPLGPRRVIGIIIEVLEHGERERSRLRRALSLPDAGPLLPPDIMNLCTFAAHYYHAPVGEALVNTLPADLRSLPRAPARAPLLWRATAESLGLGTQALGRAPQQAAALATLQAQGPLSGRACAAAGIERVTLRALQKKGLASSEVGPDEPECDRDPCEPQVAQPPLLLNAEQQRALDTLESDIGRFSCHLLEGVTGSGKTEIYLRFIKRVLEAGRQALVLVPEIGLTPQTHRRFAARFGTQVGVLHSGLGDRERLNTWRRAAQGQLRVLIGTRSALFSPLPELGAIIVDEEHDASFKQQEGFRYSARDLAVVRARRLDIPIVLGSATPSTESLANCSAGRFRLLQLTQRAGAARPPATRLVDVRGQFLDGGICAELLERIGIELAAGNQVLVFLNRRGWAPLLSCADCGWMAECAHCDARLTLHRAEGLLWCHHCDARRSAPRTCPHCKSARLLALGAGTERSEHTLQRLFPQYPILRIDRSTMQARGAMEALLDKLGDARPCILVGTQMLAKGHDFPRVTLVTMIDIDGGLFSADFRAAERTGQLLVQVAGRAGRAEHPGQVLIQTLHPQHPWLARLVAGGYRAFIDPILEERQQHGLPPYAYMALLRAESTVQERGLEMLRELKIDLVGQHPQVAIVGPVPAPMPRRAGRFRLHLLFKHSHRTPLHAAISTACQLLESRRLPGIDRWHIDVDPLEGA